MKNSTKGFAPIAIILIITAVLVLAGGGYYIAKKLPKQINVPTPVSKESSTTQNDEAADWKIFTSNTEGFTIKYPMDWVIENSSNTNCGHIKLNGSDCRDRYDFVSPDGIRVRYVIYSDENNDRNSCSTQSPCYSQKVLDLEKLNIKNLGQVYLIKQDKSVVLHKPLSDETTPVVGDNKHFNGKKDNNNFEISFSLPSKTGGRYSLFITTSFAGYEPPQLKNITSLEFYKLKSVQQGILILKSLHYAQTSVSAQNATANWKTYRNDKWGFEIKYPADWVFEETPQYIVLQNGEQKPTGWSIQYHDKQGYNTFAVKHRLIETPQGDIWDKNKYIKNIPGKVQSEENVTINSVSGTKIIYQISHQTIEEIIIQKQDDRKLWLLGLMSVEKLQYQQPSLQTMLSSFKFVK